MRYLLCALAVLTLTACASPPSESESAATSPPRSSPGPGPGPGSTSGSGPTSTPSPSPTSTSTSGSGSDQDRTIGFRLKRLDQLIETTFDRLLGNAGVNRREWQTLNVIRRGPTDEAQLTDALRPFWEGNGEKVSDVIDSLSARGWIHRDVDGRYTLTATGRDAHAAAATEVGGLRDLVSAGVSAAEFTQMMDVLQRMTVNLENAGSTSGN
ncbi:MarR family winged helix-turn-helix transcriptional regulator [Nocardia sp. NPDC059180]|uniref:MarR family winged helix-turn-helix transcriptional regulator n=1 Tax=Nocardia sp. NPDC059180 TaxID=3346761 RepID=UPI0036871507